MQPVAFHYPAVLAAAVVQFAIGGLWYSPLLFARPWMREAGLADAQLRDAPMARIFGLAFVAALVMAFNLAAFIGAKGGVAFGTFAGFATGLGWVAMSIGVLYLFERRSLRLWLINGGYLVVSFTAMGAILGAWK
jgi:hypothetical protein